MCAALHATCAEVDTGMLAACNLLIWAPIARKESAYIRVVHLGFYTCPPNVVNPLVYPNINRIRTLKLASACPSPPPMGRVGVRVVSESFWTGVLLGRQP